MSAHFSTARHSGARRYVRVRERPWPIIASTLMPVCDGCGQPFEPICPTPKCPARKTVLQMFRVEDGEGQETYYGTVPDGWGRVDRSEAMRQRKAVERPGYSRRNRADRGRRDARGRA